MLLAVLSLNAQGQGIKVNRLPVNKYANSNIAPLLIDSSLIFSSNQKLSTFKNFFNSDGDYIYKLYKVDLKNGVPKGNPKLFLKDESGRFNVGSASVTKDGNYMVVCQNVSEEVKNSNGKRGNTYGLYFSERNLSGKWSRLKPLVLGTKKLNNLIHPALSDNGKFLAFASDMPGGEGQFDIYIAERQLMGGWSEPVNIGKPINSSENELFPFFVGSTKLYFSSMRSDGYGGMDIWVSQIDNGWGKPKLLEAPINSPQDDFSCYISTDERDGYISSNRGNGDDIYHFEYVFPEFENAQPQIIDTFCFGFEETSVDSISAATQTYIWNFGDGGTAKGLSVEHCFVGPGLYKVFLNVVDAVTHEELYSVANYDLPLNYTEQVFITCPDTVKVGQSVEFDATNSKLGNLVPKDYFWVFDNKDKRIGSKVNFTFTKRGTYTVLCGVVSRENPNDRMASTRLIVVE